MKPIDRAEARAVDLYRSKGFRTAYLKGAQAAIDGLGEKSCPYRVEGWSAWRKAWHRGYRSMMPTVRS